MLGTGRLPRSGGREELGDGDRSTSTYRVPLASAVSSSVEGCATRVSHVAGRKTE